MPFYQKRPVTIEAVQWLGHNFIEIDNFITIPHETFPSQGIIKIPTLEGVMEASKGDYIIKGIKGEFYPCRPDIFAETYLPLGQPDIAELAYLQAERAGMKEG